MFVVISLNKYEKNISVMIAISPNIDVMNDEEKEIVHRFFLHIIL